MGSAGAGGSAAASGFDYQHRCTAWFLTRLLAGAGAASLPGLWSGLLTRVACETGEPVDDIRAQPAVGAAIAIQVKHTIRLEVSSTSEFAKVVRQFVAHHLSEGHEDDHLVLCTTQKTGEPIRDSLRSVLQRLRSLDPVDDPMTAARNGRESVALRRLRTHAEREWRVETQLPATPAQIRELLTHCYVQILDVDPGGGDETRALDLLRDLVVTSATADSAWAMLIRRAARLAAERSGTDAASLRRHIVEAGVPLRSEVSLRSDVERLEAASRRERNLLSEGLVTIPGPSGCIRIDREAVAEVVARGAVGPLLLVGDPGVGKTAAMRELALSLDTAGTVSLFMPVGGFRASSLGELRNELGLDHDLLEVLAGWAPSARKVLLVDALDAARADGRAGLWQHLIDAVSNMSGWHVVASVRTWDFEHSARLSSAFAGAHLTMADLTNREVGAAAATWPLLATLISKAPPDLLRILHNPFNLRLAAVLLLQGTRQAEMTQIASRVELLDKFWEARVADEPLGIARDHVARRVAEEALSNKSLAARTADVLRGDSAAGSLLADLMSRAVLVDTSAIRTAAPSVVRFSHHVLFDHAVSLTFAEAPDSLLLAIAADPNLVLFARPSIELHLQRLWLRNRESFWATSFELISGGPGTRLAAITALQVAARSVHELRDLDDLLIAVLNDNATREQYEALRFLALAVSLYLEDRPDAPAGVWPAVAERLSLVAARTELPLRLIVASLLDRPAPLAGGDLRDVGVAARRWLSHEWLGDPHPATRLAISAVIRTAASDVLATEELLRQSLDPERLVTHGADDLPALCEGVPTLSLSTPTFVADLYRAVMAYEETSNEITSMWGSRILGLTSNRRQDVDQAKWMLAEHFSAFLTHAFSAAVDALGDLVASRDEEIGVLGGLLGTRAVGMIDDPDAWHHDFRNNYREDDPAALLRHLEEHLATFADSASVRTCLDCIAARPRPTALWSAVLSSARRSDTVAEELGPLADVVALWGNSYLNSAVADLIRARKGQLEPTAHRGVEAAIADLAPHPDGDALDPWREHARYRRLRDALDAPEDAPGPEESESSRLDAAINFPEEQSTPDGEVPVLVGEIERLNFAGLEESTGSGLIQVHVDAVRAVLGVDRSALSPSVRRRTEAAITEAAGLWCGRARELDPTVVEFARQVLTDVVLLGTVTDSVPDVEDESWGEMLFSVTPATRAAQGLTALGRHSDYATNEVWDSIRRLAANPSPPVRALVADGITNLSETNPDLMWELLATLAESDSSSTVLRTIARVIPQLPRDDPRGLGILTTIASRALPRGGRGSPIAECTSVAGCLWTLRGRADVRALAEELCDRAEPDAVGAMLHQIRGADGFTSDDDAIRMRTFELSNRLIDRGLREIHGWQGSTTQTPDVDVARRRSGFHLLEKVATQLAFATGFQHADQDSNRSPGPAELRFAVEATPLLEKLTRVPHAGLIHRTVQSIAYLLEADPERALRLMHAFVIDGGRAGGYQYEVLAVAEVVDAVERILADHRFVLRNPRAVDQLRDLLEVFVDAGWPAAHRLTFSIEQILR